MVQSQIMSNKNRQHHGKTFNDESTTNNNKIPYQKTKHLAKQITLKAGYNACAMER